MNIRMQSGLMKGFLCGWGFTAFFFQVPLVKMIVEDPQALYLGSWTASSFMIFSLVTFIGISFIAGVIFAVLFRVSNRIGYGLLTLLSSWAVASELVYFASYSLSLADGVYPYIMGIFFLGAAYIIWRNRVSFEKLIQVCSVFTIPAALAFGYFCWPSAAHIKTNSYRLPPQAIKEPLPPVFFLTFEKVVFSYVTDEKGHILKDRFPNLAQFVKDADFYQNAYANSSATILSLQTLYTGKEWGTVSSEWKEGPNVRDLLGAGRPVRMILDLLDYCDPMTQTCVRTIGTDHISVRYLMTGWYKTFLKPFLPPSIKTRLGWETWVFNPWDDLWNQQAASEVVGVDSKYLVGQRQFSQLRSILEQEPANSSPLYIMHNFITDVPGTKSSVFKGRSQADYLNDLELARKNLEPFDRELGMFLDLMKKKGFYDRSLIMITADTGYDPGLETEEINEDLPASPELLRVFLAIKRPNQKEGRVFKSAARQSDVLPTILHHLNFSTEGMGFTGLPIVNPSDELTLSARPLDFYAPLLTGVKYFQLNNEMGRLRLQKQR